MVNLQEYNILSRLDSKYKWIARNEENEVVVYKGLQ